MKKWILPIIVLLLGFLANAQQKELRGTWLAWAGNAVPSTDDIVEIMDSLAAANFNIVYADVWRNGFPYFHSETFFELTGYYTDPEIEKPFQPERDVLAEMIVEAHRVGLEVEAWFESGFNGAANDSSSPLILAKPEWFARSRNDSIAFYGQAGPSMIQCHPEVQQFLIDMCREVIMKYDIDGIDMDRIRYPQLDAGYDPVTVAIYQSEHSGESPPDNIADAEWKQWRADKLTEFMGRMYDSLRAVNPEVTVSNAPLPWGPAQFCQDWSPWINNGYLDIVVPQMYFTTNAGFALRLNNELQYVDDDELVYPGISTVANDVYTEPAELAAMIETIRNQGLHGNVIWYHANLIWHANRFLSYLKRTVYAEPAEIPYRDHPRRLPAIVISEESEDAERIGNWKTYSGGIPLYEGSCRYSTVGSGDSINYFAEVPIEGWYEVYAFVNRQPPNATTQAKYLIESENGSIVHYVNQKRNGNAGRWEKLADVKLNAGRQRILTLSTDASDGKYVFTDAVMLLNTNRREKYLVNVAIQPTEEPTPRSVHLAQNFPNPFNAATTIRFSLPRSVPVSLALFDLRGRKVADLIQNQPMNSGQHYLSLEGLDLASGIYLYRMTAGKVILSKKMLFLK